MKANVIKLNPRFLGFSNWCYIVECMDSSSSVVIDASWNLDMFVRIFEERKIIPKSLFLTHSHFDHISLVNKFIERYNVRIYMSADEIEHYKFKSPNLYGLDNNQIICVDNMNVKCFLTPGHTKGSMCFQIDDNLFTGDTVFYEGCGMCNTLGGSALDMYHSIQFIKEFFPQDTKIYSGHTYCRSVGAMLKEIMRDNIYFNIDNANDFINFRMRPLQKKLFDFI